MKALSMIILAFALSWLPAAAHALDAADNPPNQLSYFDGSGIVSCPNDPDPNSNQWQSGVLVRVTNCVQLAIINATEVFLDDFSSEVSPIIDLFLLLVVIFYGVTLLTSQEEGGLKGSTMLLIIKIGAVFLFANNFGGMMMNAFGATEEMQTALVGTLNTTEAADESANDTLGNTSTTCQVTDPGTAPSDDIAPSGVQLWAQLDCILSRLLGYGGKYLLPTTVFGLMSSMAGTGAIGGIVLLLCIATLATLILFVLRVVYIFLVAYMYLGFLIVISPMIIPLLLWQKTADIFEIWLRNLAAALILPGIVFAYLCIVMPVLDGVIFDGPVTWTDQFGQSHNNGQGGLLYVLGNGSPDQADTNAQNAHRALSQVCSMSNSSFDPSFVKARTGADAVNPSQLFNGDTRNILIPALSAASDPCYQLQTTSLDFGQGTPGKIWEIGVTMTELMLTAIMLSFMMKEIPQLVYGFIGGASALTSLGSNALPGERQLQGAFSRLQGNAIGKSSILGKLSGFLR